MPGEPATCGKNRAEIWRWSRANPAEKWFEIPDQSVQSIRWERIRDDASAARVYILNDGCCDEVGDMRTVINLLHIYRDDELVWVGPIIRIEYEFLRTEVYAEDFLWVAKNRVLDQGYDHTANGAINVQIGIDLLNAGTFAPYGDQWDQVNNLVPRFGPDDSISFGQVNNFQVTTFQRLDWLAAYSSLDYTVIGREIHWWDVNYRWIDIDPITEQDMSKYPRIVEYGNEAATRVVRTDGGGYAGQARANLAFLTQYPTDVDELLSSQEQAEAGTNIQPSPATLANWALSAGKALEDALPPVVSVRVPENSTLLPSCTWDINTVMCGSWFDLTVSGLCRPIDGQLFRLRRMVVTQDLDGERVEISCDPAPVRYVTV